jgi:glucosyl-dolichyl phosphate glucuronosyltransferase
MFLSVIVPTLNRSFLLKKFLCSILEQTIDPAVYEVLVVDNGSTDDTYNTVTHFFPLISNLKYFYEASPGLHSGRHRGFLEARGDVLVYADDDIEAFPTWLETIQQCFYKNDVAMVGGKNLPRFESNPPQWLEERWEPDYAGYRMLEHLSILDLGDRPKFVSPFLIFGCNFSVRRQILKEADGFHPDSMPKHLVQYRGDGESHISRYVASQKHKAFYHPDASVYHWVSNDRMTINYFCSRSYNQGISDSYTQLRKTHELVFHNRFKCKTSLNQAFNFFLAIVKRMFFFKSYREIFIQLLSKIKSNSKSNSLLKRELESVWFQIDEAYKTGYAFHQQLVEKDQELFAWVTKPNYWSFISPESTNSTLD